MNYFEKNILPKIKYLASVRDKVIWSKSGRAFIGYDFYENAYWVDKYIVSYDEKTNTININYLFTDFL